LPQDLAYRFFNTFFFGGSYALYHKYQEVIYEGDKLTLFGVLSYNKYADQWEFEKPLSFINGSKHDLIANMSWWRAGKIVMMGLNCLVISACVGGLLWSVYRLTKRYR
jgi:zona occludens toxin (predicted ATPase)